MTSLYREGLFSGFRFFSQARTTDDVRFFRDDVDRPCLIRWEIHPLLRGDATRGKRWPSTTSLTLGFFPPSPIYVRVCECLIMTEKRRGNASLPLVSAVNPPCLTEAASARIGDREMAVSREYHETRASRIMNFGEEGGKQAYSISPDQLRMYSDTSLCNFVSVSLTAPLFVSS